MALDGLAPQADAATHIEHPLHRYPQVLQIVADKGAEALGVVMWLAPRPSAALVVAGGVALVVLTWLVVGNRADRV